MLVGGQVTGSIGTGLLVLLGIASADGKPDADYLIDKISELRVFPDTHKKMNLDVRQAGGALLIVPQFTLYADCRRGRRPSFEAAAPRDHAEALYNYFVEAARATGLRVATGVFQASMQVHLVNDGPVTLMIDSAD